MILWRDSRIKEWIKLLRRGWWRWSKRLGRWSGRLGRWSKRLRGWSRRLERWSRRWNPLLLKLC
jgi:hypothetical protein